jgi:oligopeptidase A
MRIGNFPAAVLNRAEKSVKKKIEKNRKELEKLLAIENKSYLNFVRPYMELSYELSSLFAPVAHLNGVKNSPKSQKVFGACLPLIAEYSAELAQNEELYNAFAAINENRRLDGAQKKVVEDSLLDFELGGVNLPKDKKERAKDIAVRLSLLSEEFNQNLIDDTLKFKLTVDDETLLGKMPESDKAAAFKDGVWEFGLLPPSYMAFMTYAADRAKREEMYRAYMTRAPQNGALITEILALRGELAALLGYDNYADLNNKRMSAPSAPEVLSFLYSVADMCVPFAAAEAGELRNIARECGLENLASYDLAFYAEKLKKAKFDFDEETTRPYFEAENVLNGLFSVLNRLFGLRFHKKAIKLWDEGAAYYEVHTGDTLTGGLYTDIFARPDKRGGAWMDDYHTYHIDPGGKRHLSEVMIVANFPPPADGKPSLLHHSDLVTLFHEMGHALHHLLSKVDEAALSGVRGIDWDTVEFPSQLLENFAYEPEVLSGISSHIETGEKLPPDLRDKIALSRNFQAGLSALRQLEFGIFDMLIHSQTPLDEDGVQKVLDTVRHKYTVFMPPSYNKFQNGFSHIFGGGYAAGYYSYKWAEMLAADAFLEFKRRGIFYQPLAEAYMNTVLRLGASKKMGEIYREFIGRDPDPAALAELYGMK